MVFDLNFTLSNIMTGFCIFVNEESLNEVQARRLIMAGLEPELVNIFLHARILLRDVKKKGGCT